MLRLVSSLTSVVRWRLRKEFPSQGRMLSSHILSPKKLGDIVKLELLENENSGRILHIWMEYHANKAGCAAGILSRAEHDVVMFRTNRSPLFIHPVPRDAGHFVVVGQFKGSTALVTHLDDFKKYQHLAEPYMSLSIHQELVQNKDIALVRGDFSTEKLRKVAESALSDCGGFEQDEASKLIKDVLHIYCDTSQYKHVQALNERPDSFDWQGFISARLSS